MKIVEVSFSRQEESLLNIGVAYSKGEYLFFLVNPVSFSFSRNGKRDLESVLELLDNEQLKVGIVGSTVVDGFTNNVISASISASRGKDNYPELFHQFKGFNFYDKRLNRTKIREVIAVSRNGMFIKRTTFDTLGGFDSIYHDQVRLDYMFENKTDEI